MVQNNSEWSILAILQLFQYFPIEVIQIDSEWPILDILQIFQYFPTEVVQIDSEWPILAVFQLFQYFPTKVSKTIQNGLFWLFCNFSNIFLLKLSKLIHLICCPTYRQSQRLHIAYTHVSLLYVCRQKEQCHCNLFSEIYDHILFTSHLNFTCILPLSCVFLANYVPKCQMSSGPYGPIFPICGASALSYFTSALGIVSLLFLLM